MDVASNNDTTRMHVCLRCRIAKRFNEFHKDASKKAGIGGYCKNCCKDRWKARYAANREQILARSAAHRAENPGYEAMRKRKFRADRKLGKAYDFDSHVQSWKDCTAINKQRTCRKCRRLLPLFKFTTDSSRRDGRSGLCAECNKERLRIFYHSNAAENKARRRQESKERVSALSDTYLRQLCRRRTRLKASQVPDELVEVKRIELSIKRLLKEMEDAEHS